MGNVVGGRQQVIEFGGYKISTWGETELTSDYQDIYSSEVEEPAVFYEFILQVNAKNIMIKMERNSEEVFEVDLSDLNDNWKLNGNNSTKSVELLGLSQFAVNRWRFKPPVPMEFVSLKVQMKKISGNNRKVLRGKIGWGER